LPGATDLRPAYKDNRTRRPRIIQGPNLTYFHEVTRRQRIRIWVESVPMSTKEIRDYLRKIGRKGAQVTNRKLTPQQRTESARRAAQARWAKAKKKTQ